MAHGGYVFMLADTAFACACNSHGPVTVAAGADITFLRPTGPATCSTRVRERAGDQRPQRHLRRHRDPRRRRGRRVPRPQPRGQTRDGRRDGAAPRAAAPATTRTPCSTAAVRLFNERGYEATSMGDIAESLGITKSSIYHHVSGKEQLLQMAIDQALDGLFEAADRGASARPARRSSGSSS